MPEQNLNFARHPAWARYTVALVSVSVGWLAREMLTKTVGKDQLPFVFFFPAIAIAAWYGGLGPGLVATVLSAAMADWYYLGPGHLTGLTAVYDAVALAAFIVSCGFILGAIQMMHQSQRRLLRESAGRKAVEATLAEETELISTTLRSIGEAVITTESSGKINFINKEAEQFTGWTLKEAVGQSLRQVFKIINEETRASIEFSNSAPPDDSAVSSLKNHILLISKTGQETAIDLTIAPIRRKDGNVGGVIVVFRDVSEKRLAHRISARLAAIVEYSGDAILTKDLNSIIQSWNAGAQRLFGYAAEEMIGKPITVLFPPDRLTEEDHIISLLRQGRPVERFETVRVSKSGRRIPVIVSISPIRDSNGHIIGASKIVQDMSELMATREELVREKELLATTLASIGDAVMVTDATGRVSFLNQEAERLTGWKTAEAANRPLSEVFKIVNEHTREPAEDPVAKVMRLGNVVGLANHTILIARDGKETPIDDSAAPIRKDGGPLHGIILVFRDFSERKRLEQQQHRLYNLVQAVNQARALSQIYEAALDAISECLQSDRCSILLYDPDGVMRFKAWRNLSEEYRRAVEGHSPWSPEAKDPEPVCIEDANQVEGELRSALLRERIAALGFVPITYNGKLLGKFMVYYDEKHTFKPDELRLGVTVASQVALAIRRRRTQEELETLVRERTAKLREMIAELQHVSYAITHDMRAPLRAMSTFAGLIHEGLSAEKNPPPELLDSCRRIMTSATRLDQLIKDALNYTKAVLQELPLHPVDLARLIPSLIESYPNLQTDKADITIEDPLPVVLGEESLLTQCFSNLLGNAVKFVAPGVRPRVQIHVQRSGETATISVQDNGIGIAPDSQRRLFGMFERLTTGYEGTGIGLAIVRKVVERMGGKVGADSEPGKGSRFWVILKTAPVSQSSASLPISHGDH